MVRHRISSNCNVVVWCVRIPIRKIEEQRMKNILPQPLCPSQWGCFIYWRGLVLKPVNEKRRLTRWSSALVF